MTRTRLRLRAPAGAPTPNAGRARPRLAIAAMVAIAMTSTVAAAPVAVAEEPATQVDAAVSFYALDYSVSHPEAHRRLERIQPMQDILAAVRDLEGPRVAGWGIDHDGPMRGWVWLTGDGSPGAAAAEIAGLHDDIEIRTGARHSLAELRAARAALFASHSGPHARTDAATGGAGGAALPAEVTEIVAFTGLDLRANAVRVGIDPGLASGPTARIAPVSNSEFVAKAAEVAEVLEAVMRVDFTVEDGRGIATDNGADFRGGETIGVCTSGFAARKNGGGAYGMITAGHCGDPGPNDRRAQVMHGVSLPFDYGWGSTSADAQFHTIPVGVGHQLYDSHLCHDDPTTWCNVGDQQDRTGMLNDYVCHAGRRSGVSCGTVVDIEYQPARGVCRSSSDIEVDCNAVFVEATGPNLRSCDGDSGGPWFSKSEHESTAYGIHLGSDSLNNCTVTGVSAIFSAMDEVERFLGVQMLTGGPVDV